ncbi:DUF4198 domain-containing protein [Erythrobacter litoralis]|uniref:DUF4198 domain-containing protein n=1 Tax=Erythrobacter litoralis TaxID=39960 RepID=UPI0024359A12|nr:DUF4198 domain-containing protein [Erythrobacter litoralis]MDG6077700.1 DUF4198 domain-containing protein [Erythrobacter litoralis]
MFAKPSLFAASLALGFSAFLPTAAEAHRRWLLPSSTVMAGEEETITVDAAASNGLFIFEHRPLGLDDLVVTGPDGQVVEPDVIGTGSYRSVFDLKLERQGTYRIAIASNGMIGSYELDGERRRWRGSREDMASGIPAGAINVSVSENVARTETFVTLGAPNETALAPTNVGLEMIPVTHPNDLIAGETAQMRFLMDGAPAAGIEIEFVAGGTRYRDEPGIQTLTTDADGMITLDAGEPGLYYLEASAGRGEYEDGPPNRRLSYTAVLEFMPL